MRGNNKGHPATGGLLKPRGPWEVFRAARPSDPDNPLRYSSILKVTFLMVALAAIVTLLTIPERNMHREFLGVVQEARDFGVPELPRTYATEEDLEEFFEEWQISCAETVNGESICQYIADLSDVRTKFDEDSSLLFAALMGSLIAVLLTVAVAFARALNNLYALGNEDAKVPQAWALVGFWIPILNLVLPWYVVDRTWSAAWSGEHGSGEASRPSVIGAAWGISAIVTFFLNPIMVTWVFRRSGTDGWVTYLEWMDRALLWTPVPVIMSALLLAIIWWRQRRRAMALDAAALSQRPVGSSNL